MNSVNQKTFSFIKSTCIVFFIVLNPMICKSAELPFKGVDSIYTETIRSVQFFPVSSIQQRYPYPPVTSIITQNLVLYFDELGEDASNFNAAIFHCNSDWTRTDIPELDYLYDFNEFNLDQGELSFDTKIAYTHYKFICPRVKLSGNYILVIYRDFDPENIVITRRFSIFQKQVEIESNSSVMAYGSKQGVDFNVYYQDLGITNPLRSIKPVIRQNGVSDNVVDGFEPTFISNEKLQYKFVNTKAGFEGGNEYRMFDLRSVEFNGVNIIQINRNTTPTNAYIYPDKSRNSGVYQDEEDINGNYVIDHYEFNQGSTQSDYINVYFKLETPKSKDKIYVYGALSDWKLSKEFEMRWDSEEEFYYCRPLLKQGYYNYSYAKNIKGKAIQKDIEGSFAYSENLYEIFIFHRSLNGRYDKLIGYQKITLFPKR